MPTVADLLAEEAAGILKELEKLIRFHVETPDELPTEANLASLRKFVDELDTSLSGLTDELRDRKDGALKELQSTFANVPSEWHQSWEAKTSEFAAQAEQLQQDCDEICMVMDAEQSDVGADKLILRTLQTDDIVFDLASRDLRRRLAIDAIAGDRAGESKFEVLRDAQQRLYQLATISRQRLMSHRNHKVKKPLLNEGEIVYAYSASDAKMADGEPWQRATIKSHRELGPGHGYGPSRLYTVHFHHKRDPEEINDYEVNTWGTDDYDRAKAVGSSNTDVVKRGFDEHSTDLWAKQIGWFVALPGEEELHFPCYSDAVAAYDTRIIEVCGLDKGLEEGLVFDGRWYGYRKRATNTTEASDRAKLRCHLRIQVMHMKEHLPEGDMKLIGEVLVEMTEPDQLFMNPNDVDVDLSNEMIGYAWRMARRYFLNGCEQLMRKGVFRHALMKDAVNKKRARADALLMNYLEAAGDIDKFSTDMPNIQFARDSCSSLDDTIGYLDCNTPEAKHIDIRSVHRNGITSEWYVNPDSRPLQGYLKAYATQNNTTVKSLRLKYNDRTVFLSSIRDKTPAQLGMTDGGTLEVTFIQSTAEEAQPPKPKSLPSSSKKSKGKKKKHRKSNKKRSTQPASFENEGEKMKEQHSQSLSRVFEEADATFRSIRQKLEAMNLERTLPKEKRSRPKLKVVPTEPIDNPLTDGLAGKAGKTHFIVQVGETNNLYNTRGSKQSAGRIAWEVDLHRCTQEEALERLDECLPEWVDTAMKGEYPWVIAAKIVCGGGSQVLSEAVEGWIKRNPNVSNAPKNLYA